MEESIQYKYIQKFQEPKNKEKNTVVKILLGAIALYHLPSALMGVYMFFSLLRADEFHMNDISIIPIVMLIGKFIFFTGVFIVVMKVDKVSGLVVMPKELEISITDKVLRKRITLVKYKDINDKIGNVEENIIVVNLDNIKLAKIENNAVIIELLDSNPNMVTYGYTDSENLVQHINNFVKSTNVE